jgi:hypothetical protein
MSELNEFEKEAQNAKGGAMRELVGFLRENKKWWLIPLLLAVILLGLVVALGATGAAPFIYTLF